MISEWLEQNIERVRTRAGGGWRAQSEVLGVALLTAIVVILVATVALFLFTDFASEQNEERYVVSVESSMTSENLTIQHAGGDTFDAEGVSVIVQGDTNYEMTLDEFNETEGDTFSPGSVWREFGLNNTGDMRLLVIDEQSNTILHDQFYEITVEDVRLLVNGSDHSAEVTGVNEADLPGGNDRVRQVNYTRQVQYSTGEGWVNVTEGVDDMEYQPTDQDTLTNLADEGVLEATAPEDDTEEIRVRTSYSTPIGNDTYSNWVTVTVNDAEVGADVTFDDDDIYASANGDDLKVDWQAENTALLDIPVQFDADIEVTNGDDEVINSTVQEDVTIFEGGTIDETFTLRDINPTTEDIEVEITGTDGTDGTEDYSWVNGDSESQKFEKASFAVSSFTASHDGGLVVDIDYNVTNIGDWSAERNVEIGVETFDAGGDTLDTGTLLNGDVPLESGESQEEQLTYDFTDSGTANITAEIDATNDTDTDTVDINPAEFEVQNVEAQLVSLEDEEYIEVNYTVTNPGDLPDEQDISLTVDEADDPAAINESVQLAGGESVDGTFQVEDFDTSVEWGETTTIPLTVETDDDSGEDGVEIVGPDFDLNITSAETDGDGNIVVDYEINNTGGLEGTSAIEPRVTSDSDWNSFRQYSTLHQATVSGDQAPYTNTFTLEISEDEVSGGQTYVRVLTDEQDTDASQDTAEVDVTPPTYEVDATFSQEGEEILVDSYTVTNTGDIAGSIEDVTYEVVVDDVQDSGGQPGITDGQELHSANHEGETIEPGQSVTGSFTGGEALDLGDEDLNNVDSFDINASIEAGDGGDFRLFQDLGPAYFEVSNVDAEYYWDEEAGMGKADVTYDLENTGGLEGERTVYAESSEDSASTMSNTTLGPTEGPQEFTQTVDITHQGPQNILVYVTDEGYGEDMIDPAPAQFVVSNVDANFEPENGAARVSFDVENEGDFADTRTIEIRSGGANGPTEDVPSVNLGPGEDTSVDNELVDVNDDGAVTITADPGPDPHQEGIGSVFVSGPEFEIDSLSASWDSNNQEAVVDATIVNTGDLQGTQTISLAADSSDSNDDTSLTLPYDTDQEVTLEAPYSQDEVQGGPEIPLEVCSEDNCDDTTLDVQGVDLSINWGSSFDKPTSGPYDFGMNYNLENNWGSSVSSLDFTVTVVNNGDVPYDGDVVLDRGAYTPWEQTDDQSFSVGVDGDTTEADLSWSPSRDDVNSNEDVNFEASVNDGGVSATTSEHGITLTYDPYITSDSFDVSGGNNGIGSCGSWYDPRASTDLSAELSVSLNDPSGLHNQLSASFSTDSSFVGGSYSLSDQSTSGTSVSASDSDCTTNPAGSVDVDVNYDISPGGDSGSNSGSTNL